MNMLQDNVPIIWVLGGPNSGKTVQCDKILDTFSFVYINPIDLVVNEIASGSTRGKRLANTLHNQKPIPVEEEFNLVQNEIDHAHNVHGFVVDGYPRDIAQAREFEERIGVVDIIIYLECSDVVMMRRGSNCYAVPKIPQKPDNKEANTNAPVDGTNERSEDETTQTHVQTSDMDCCPHGITLRNVHCGICVNHNDTTPMVCCVPNEPGPYCVSAEEHKKMSARFESFHISIQPILETYAHKVAYINVDRPPDDVFEDVLCAIECKIIYGRMCLMESMRPKLPEEIEGSPSVGGISGQSSMPKEDEPTVSDKNKVNEVEKSETKQTVPEVSEKRESEDSKAKEPDKPEEVEKSETKQSAPEVSERKESDSSKAKEPDIPETETSEESTAKVPEKEDKAPPTEDDNTKQQEEAKSQEESKDKQPEPRGSKQREADEPTQPESK